MSFCIVYARATLDVALVLAERDRPERLRSWRMRCRSCSSDGKTPAPSSPTCHTLPSAGAPRSTCGASARWSRKRRGDVRCLAIALSRALSERGSIGAAFAAISPSAPPPPPACAAASSYAPAAYAATLGGAATPLAAGDIRPSIVACPNLLSSTSNTATWLHRQALATAQDMHCHAQGTWLRRIPRHVHRVEVARIVALVNVGGDATKDTRKRCAELDMRSRA